MKKWREMTREQKLIFCEKARGNNGLSFGEIGELVEATRSQIAGFVHRWITNSSERKIPIDHLPKKKRRIKPTYRKPQTLKLKRSGEDRDICNVRGDGDYEQFAALRSPKMKKPLENVGPGIPWQQRKSNQCCWPLWKSKSDPHRNCCGEEIDLESSFGWCEYHRSIGTSKQRQGSISWLRKRQK